MAASPLRDLLAVPPIPLGSADGSRTYAGIAHVNQTAEDLSTWCSKEFQGMDEERQYTILLYYLNQLRQAEYPLMERIRLARTVHSLLGPRLPTTPPSLRDFLTLTRSVRLKTDDSSVLQRATDDVSYVLQHLDDWNSLGVNDKWKKMLRYIRIAQAYQRTGADVRDLTGHIASLWIRWIGRKMTWEDLEDVAAGRFPRSLEAQQREPDLPAPGPSQGLLLGTPQSANEHAVTSEFSSNGKGATSIGEDGDNLAPPIAPAGRNPQNSASRRTQQRSPAPRCEECKTLDVRCSGGCPCELCIEAGTACEYLDRSEALATSNDSISARTRSRQRPAKRSGPSSADAVARAQLAPSTVTPARPPATITQPPKKRPRLESEEPSDEATNTLNLPAHRASCEHCRRLKSKCYGGIPCPTCRKAGVQCVYKRWGYRTHRDEKDGAPRPKVAKLELYTRPANPDDASEQAVEGRCFKCGHISLDHSPRYMIDDGAYVLRGRKCSACADLKGASVKRVFHPIDGRKSRPHKSIAD